MKPLEVIRHENIIHEFFKENSIVHNRFAMVPLTGEKTDLQTTKDLQGIVDELYSANLRVGGSGSYFAQDPIIHLKTIKNGPSEYGFTFSVKQGTKTIEGSKISYLIIVKNEAIKTYLSHFSAQDYLRVSLFSTAHNINNKIAKQHWNNLIQSYSRGNFQSVNKRAHVFITNKALDPNNEKSTIRVDSDLSCFLAEQMPSLLNQELREKEGRKLGIPIKKDINKKKLKKNIAALFLDNNYEWYKSMPTLKEVINRANKDYPEKKIFEITNKQLSNNITRLGFGLSQLAYACELELNEIVPIFYMTAGRIKAHERQIIESIENVYMIPKNVAPKISTSENQVHLETKIPLLAQKNPRLKEFMPKLCKIKGQEYIKLGQNEWLTFTHMVQKVSPEAKERRELFLESNKIISEEKNTIYALGLFYDFLREEKKNLNIPYETFMSPREIYETIAPHAPENAKDPLRRFMSLYTRLISKEVKRGKSMGVHGDPKEDNVLGGDILIDLGSVCIATSPSKDIARIALNPHAFRFNEKGEFDSQYRAEYLDRLLQDYNKILPKDKKIDHEEMHSRIIIEGLRVMARKIQAGRPDLINIYLPYITHSYEGLQQHKRSLRTSA